MASFAGISSRRLAIDGGCHDQPVHLLEAPALTDHLVGEPVEQFGVGRPLTQDAEVARGFDQPPAEVMRARSGWRARVRRAGARREPDSGRRRADGPRLAGSDRRARSRIVPLRAPRWSGHPGPTAFVGWRWSPRWKTCVSGSTPGASSSTLTKSSTGFSARLAAITSRSFFSSSAAAESYW